MKALLISGGTTLTATEWDIEDILTNCSPKEQVEKLDLREKEIKKQEFYYKHRMELLEH